MIEVQGLTKSYGSVAAVRDLSFSVAPGEVLGLVGPNGAGKTTTLRSLAGIVRPAGGVNRIRGQYMGGGPGAPQRPPPVMPPRPPLFGYPPPGKDLPVTPPPLPGAGRERRLPC